MKHYLYCIIILFTINVVKAQSFESTNVTISANKKYQWDSIGYNITSSLSSLIYNEILKNKITVWDSPNKEIKISIEALKGIELDNQCQFINTELLLIHEIWEMNKRYLETQTIGFSFMATGISGKINLGFVEYKDVVSLLNQNKIPCNANGNYNMTYRSAIQNKKFDFSIIQFGNDDFNNNPHKANELYFSIFKNPKIKLYNETSGKTQNAKKINYKIYEKDEDAKYILETISNYFYNNKEIFFNLGGDSIYNFIETRENYEINYAEIEEIWNIDENKQEVLQIKIFINGKSISITNPILENFNSLFIKFSPFYNYLAEKNYPYEILSINNQNFEQKYTQQIISALQKRKFSTITYQLNNE